MRDFILRNFGRLFAVLGCSTLVTACYGVPYDDFHASVSGSVLDADSAEPIEGIQVKMTVGHRSQGVGNTVQSLVPDEESVTVTSDRLGQFSEIIRGYGEVDGVIIECIDIDADANGSYLPKSQVYDIDEAEDVVITLQKLYKASQE